MSAVESSETDLPAPTGRPTMAIAACMVLGAYGASAVFSYSGVCLAAVPGPFYYIGSYVGTALFAIIGALGVRQALSSEAASRAAWGLASFEAFAVAAFILSTIQPNSMCAVWPGV